MVEPCEPFCIVGHQEGQHKKIRQARSLFLNGEAIPGTTDEYGEVIEPARPEITSYACIKVGGAYQHFCYRLINYTVPVCGWKRPPPLFELLVFAIVVFSSAALAINSPNNSPAVFDALFYIDVTTTVLFTIEIALKCSATGFIMHDNSYLRDPYNCIDFVVVVVGILSLFIAGSERGGPQVSVARLFRALRPLRMISQNRGLQMIVNALIFSIRSIVDVVVVVFFCWLLFALLGMSFFKGKFFHCNDPAFPPGQYRFNESDPCTSEVTFFDEERGLIISREWVNQDMNFDNIGYAFLSLFVFATGEGWPDVMFNACDTTEIDYQPLKNNNPVAAVFFVLYVTVSGFFIMELFTGAIFEQFLRLKNEADQFRRGFLITDEQKKWVVAIKALAHTNAMKPQRPRRVSNYYYQQLVRKVFWVIMSPWFTGAVIAFIALNTIVMAMVSHNSPQWYSDLLDDLNHVFVWIFVCEMVLRLVGLGVRGYFKSNWNKFDCLVVCGSLFDLYYASRSKIILFRIFRVFRVFRLLQVFPGFKLVFDSLMEVLPIMMNVGTLIFLLYFVFAVMGVSLFGEVPRGNGIDEYNNFENWGAAMVTLFRVSTGEEWQELAFQCAKGPNGYWVAIIYFLVFVWISCMVVLNIFVMVISAGMEENNTNTRKTLAKDLTHILAREFRYAWAHYDPDATMWLEIEKLPELLKYMEQKPRPEEAETKEHNLFQRSCCCCVLRYVEEPRCGLDKGTLKTKCGLRLHGKDMMSLEHLVEVLMRVQVKPPFVHFRSILVGLFTCMTEITLGQTPVGLYSQKQQKRLKSKNRKRAKSEAIWAPEAYSRKYQRFVLESTKSVTDIGDANEQSLFLSSPAVDDDTESTVPPLADGNSSEAKPRKVRKRTVHFNLQP
eukprot:SAG11_NODE_1893_length_4102_cov_4.762678_1_plen_891_part_00